MLFNYKETSSLDISFDDVSHELIVNDDTIVEETLVRRLKDMDQLFLDSKGYDSELPLYYMYNGLYHPQDKELFVNAGIKYEYTLLLPTLINGECIKAHGHIHGISPLTKTNFLEAYEVLQGEGYFELFKINEDFCDVVLVKVKTGDFVMIPPEYYHLSINTGDTPFNFGDLIIWDGQSDYSLLKLYEGAPFYCLKDQEGNISFELNETYKDKKIRFSHVEADTVPWKLPQGKLPLYSSFVEDPKYFDFLR